MVAFVSDRSLPEEERTFHGPWVTPSSLGEMQRDFEGWDEMVVGLFPVSPAYECRLVNAWMGLSDERGARRNE